MAGRVRDGDDSYKLDARRFDTGVTFGFGYEYEFDRIGKVGIEMGTNPGLINLIENDIYSESSLKNRRTYFRISIARSLIDWKSLIF